MHASRAGGGAERLERVIRGAVAAGRPAIAAFLTAGYPRLDGFADLARRVAAAADLLEIGVPFTDPMADGATIQRASHAALRNGVRLPWILEVAAVSATVAPVVLMSYLNPLIAFGTRRLVRAARDAGVAGLVVPDLPLEESPSLRRVCEDGGLALAPMTSPVTPPDRLMALAEAGRGFVYAVTSTGTTGGSAPVSPEMLGYLDRVRSAATVPVLAGFGVRSAAQVATLSGHADGVVVGSALIETLDTGGDPAAFLGALRVEAGRGGRDHGELPVDGVNR